MYRLISGHSTAVYLLYVFDVCQGHYPRTARVTPEAYQCLTPYLSSSKRSLKHGMHSHCRVLRTVIPVDSFACVS